MYRECSHCCRPFTKDDFVKEESRGMESERKAMGLEGTRFLFYTCPRCAYADIFIDILALPGDTPEGFQERRGTLEATVKGLHAEGVEVVVTAK